MARRPWFSALDRRVRRRVALTIWFRLAAGGNSEGAVATGAQPLIWVSVSVTDFALAAVQVWLLRRGVFRRSHIFGAGRFPRTAMAPLSWPRSPADQPPPCRSISTSMKIVSWF